jgi:hypothetical protein
LERRQLATTLSRAAFREMEVNATFGYDSVVSGRKP